MAEQVIQRSFAGGEVSPSMYGRADQVKYQTGTKTCRNFKVMKHGGVANRSGTQFKTEVKTSANKTYFLKFVFNADQTYVIEAGNLYMRFIRLGAQVNVSGVTAWSAATNYVVGDLASRLGVNYYCILAHINQQPPNATYWYPLTGTIYEIPTPYVTADLSTLKFVQSGDVVTITHPNYAPRELIRTGHTAWTLTVKPFAPTISAPAGLAVTAPGAAATVWRYKVTAVKSETYEESVGGTAAGDAGDTPTVAAPHTLTWNAVSGAGEYNVYRETADGSGTYAFIGVAASNSWTNNGSTIPDQSTTSPITRTVFASASNYPSTVSYYQQRQIFGNTDNDIEKVWTTRTGMFDNITVSSPLQDDDAVTFTIAGRQVNEIRHMVEIDAFVILTSGGEWVVLGDSDGVLRANQPPNLKQIGYNGASDVMPVIVNNSLVYCQARGSIVRDLRNEVQASGGSTYNGRDLSVFAGHLFRGKTIDRMDYAQIPDSIIWTIRSDGVMLGLTYLRDHEIWGWHRHDTDGDFEDVCVVPEGNEDILYVIVKRIVNGTTKRYIERMPTRDFTDINVDAIFMDSYLTYDGRNTGATTMSLSTGAGWTVDDTITITAAAGTPFVAGDVGNWFVLNIVDSDLESETYGEITDTVTITVAGYTDTTHVTGTPSKTVPAALRGVATTSWSRAVDSVSGLDHLEAKDVSVFADGNVVANPNNNKYEVLTVATGAISLERCFSIIHVGLPITADFRTLDLDVQGTQIRAKAKDVTHISLLVENTRGIFAGPQFPEDIPAANRIDATDKLEGMTELQPQQITDYGEPWPLQNGIVEMNIASTWDSSGSFAVRQTDPLPITILSAIPMPTIGG